MTVTFPQSALDAMADQPGVFPLWERAYECADDGEYTPGETLHMFVLIKQGPSLLVLSACSLIGSDPPVRRDTRRRLRKRTSRHCGICTIAAVEAGLV